MSKLIYANFFRLFKNRLFLFGIGFMFLAGCFLVFQQYRQAAGYGLKTDIENTFFVYTQMIGVISAIFCSLFLHAEYGDGTVRNKIIAGHKRVAVYFANLVVNIAAPVMLCLPYMLANIIIGIPLIGNMDLPLVKVLTIVCGSMISLIAICSVLTMVSLLVQTKAVAPVICILIIFLSMAFLNEVQRMLDQPQYWYDGTLNTTSYVDGVERDVLQFIYDATPTGQEMQYSRKDTDKALAMSAYAAGLTVITTGIGMFFFKRKDLR